MECKDGAKGLAGFWGERDFAGGFDGGELSHFFFASEQIFEGIAVQDGEESGGGFVQDIFESAGGENGAGVVALIVTVHHDVIGLGEAEDMADANLGRGTTESKAATDTAAGGQETVFGEGMNDFGKVVAGDLECAGDLVNGGKGGSVQSCVHEDAEGVIGELAESHDGM